MAPHCTTNAENKQLPKGSKISVFRFPADESIKKRWTNAVPKQNFKAPLFAGLCVKHFVYTDFQTESTDSNSSRKGKKELYGSLRKNKLKEDAIPTHWPGCPALLYLPRDQQHLP